MIEDARTELSGDFSCDTLIVGSGAAGIALALALGRKGRDVLLIEAGGDRAAPEQEPYRTASVSPVTHHLGHEFRRRAFGGTTGLWGGRCIPLDPIDFEARDWIPHSGWPITYAEVDGYIADAAALCEAGPPDFDAATALPNAPAAMIEGITSTNLIVDRVERFSPPTDFAKRYGSELKTLPSVRVLLNAPAIAITTTPDGNEATGVEVAIDGAIYPISARRVVLAAGGLETTRLLLASRAARPAGLGNERGLVGRFYQTHLEGNFGQLHLPRDAQIDYERSREGVYCRRYLMLAPSAQRRDRLAQLVLRPHFPKITDPSHRNAILSAMYFAKSGLVPEYARILTGAGGGAPERLRAGVTAAHMRNIALGAPGLALFVARWLKLRTFAARKLPSVVLTHPEGLYPVNINAEQTPNPDSRLLLSDEVDSLGMPRLAVDWRLSEIDCDLLRRGLLAMRSALAPAAHFELDEATLDDAIAGVTPISHHMGTARMAETPATGVCDANGELFGTRGVYVCGAALFPTSGFANPTLTIVALALRMADHLAR